MERLFYFINKMNWISLNDGLMLYLDKLGTGKKNKGLLTS